MKHLILQYKFKKLCAKTVTKFIPSSAEAKSVTCLVRFILNFVLMKTVCIYLHQMELQQSTRLAQNELKIFNKWTLLVLKNKHFEYAL